MSTKETILKQLAENPVIIYMKGVPTAPECGFSAKAVEVLNATGIAYSYVNVMKAPFIRDRLPTVSKWPTFPQVFVAGQLIGGADIVEAMSQDGSLLPLLQAAVAPSDNRQAGSVSHSEIEKLILQDYPNAAIIIDGQGCDLAITVISERFEALPMIAQHQGVMQTLNEVIAAGRLHAVTLKTFTPTQWQAQHSASPALLQIQL
jgi:monothiol glutaredoxin